MATELIIAIGIIVVANIIIGCIFLHIRNKHIEKEVAEPTDEPTQEQEQTDTEPMNGDPAVLTPTDEGGSSTGSETAEPSTDIPPFLFEEGEWYECIAPYQDFVVGEKYQCTEHGRLDGYLIKKPNEYFKPCEAPEPSEDDDDTDIERLEAIFQGLLDYFSEILPVNNTLIAPRTYKYLHDSFTLLYLSMTMEPKGDMDGLKRLYKPENFPQIIDVSGDKDNPLVIEEAGAMLFYCLLAELVPQKRQQLAELALSYGEPIKDQEIYGWSFYSDPNVARKYVLDAYPILRSKKHIAEMRHELGGSAISYKNDISEQFLDFSKIMPAAPGPYLNTYFERPNGYPAGRITPFGDLLEDFETENYVATYYNLYTKDKEKRQATIQAIANKDHHLEHLFGKDRKVKDKKYGTMVFHPVFGHQTIGVEIPDNGAIAKLANTVGMPCSNNRKSLLNMEYGRRRPGQGEADPSAMNLDDFRALVNYAIEEGDGHTTGYYDQDGDYVDNNGTHIGDYETYFQGQLYANSYPSGHSAYIQGIGMALIAAMPDKSCEIVRALEEFRLSRVITRYHHLSDTTIGQLCGGMMMPVLFACTNIDLDGLIDLASKEYESLKP